MGVMAFVGPVVPVEPKTRVSLRAGLKEPEQATWGRWGGTESIPLVKDYRRLVFEKVGNFLVECFFFLSFRKMILQCTQKLSSGL